MVRLYTATPFLPSPAVPYVRFSLLIVTRWKPLPPRHYCDTQAHHYTLVAPVPRGPSLRGVMLSTSIIANTASSASLMDSLRLHLVQAYTKSLCHLRQILTAHQTFPNLLCISFSTCRHQYPGEPLRCICLLLHKAYQPSPNM